MPQSGHTDHYEEGMIEYTQRVGRSVVIVAQLLEWLLLTPEFGSSKPVVGKIIFYQLYWKERNKENDGPVYSTHLKVERLTKNSIERDTEHL